VPGFGGGSFGGGPFGEHDWKRTVLWENLPEIDRIMDSEEGGGALEGWQAAVGESLHPFLHALRGFENLLDPSAEELRTRFQGNISVTITATAIEVSGRSVRVTFNDPDPANPLVPLGSCSIGWEIIDSSDRKYQVEKVHKDSVAVIVEGTSQPSAGAATLRPPPLIRNLASDYGVTNDERDPEHFQRVAVRDAWKWYAGKGADDEGYKIIGKIYGHDVEVERLWYMDGTVSSAIPAADLIEYPSGSGIFYTTRPPTQPVFDEVAADVIPLDLYCWQELLWTTDGIVPPPGPLPDGTSVHDAIGSTMQGLPIVSVTALGSGLYRVRVTGDLYPVATAGLSAPRWYATFPDVGADAGSFYLEETPIDIGGGDWTFIVYSSVAPTFGTTANIDYTCDPQMTCSYCAASALKITVTPVGILTETGVIWEQMTTRLIEKIGECVPAHIRFVWWVMNAPPSVASFYVPSSHFVAS